MRIETKNPAPSSQGQPRKAEDPKKMHDAAQQFEALMISQVLKSMHSDGESWMGTSNDAAGGTAVELAEQEFAKALSLSGGLGLARMIEKGLAPHVPLEKGGPLQKLSE